MDIPNLTPPSTTVSKSSLSLGALILISLVAISLGFWASRLAGGKGGSPLNPAKALVISTDTIKDQSQIEVGKSYGNLNKSFKDSATGTIQKGSLNGEGTHILVREGGLSQRAALTSSVVDLDLFVGRKVEIKGETNASTKVSWLLDVGTVKVLE